MWLLAHSHVEAMPNARVVICFEIKPTFNRLLLFLFHIYTHFKLTGRWSKIRLRNLNTSEKLLVDFIDRILDINSWLGGKLEQQCFIMWRTCYNWVYHLVTLFKSLWCICPCQTGLENQQRIWPIVLSSCGKVLVEGGLEGDLCWKSPEAAPC